MKLCECGCGKPAPIVKNTVKQQGRIKGNPGRFIRGHNAGAKIHGMNKSKIYNRWKEMTQRCKNPHHKFFAYYGGRGITICTRWHNFENFFADMGHPPTPQHSIDRIDNDGHYSPENCRWATKKEQGNNTRRNHWIEFNGQRKTLTQWAEEFKINKTTLCHRLNTYQWTVARAFLTPVETAV